MADPLEGASVHFLHLNRTILCLTKVKSEKLHIIFEFTVMWTGRPLAVTPSYVVFQNIPSGQGLLEVQKSAGSPFAIKVGYYMSAYAHEEASLPQRQAWWVVLGIHLPFGRYQEASNVVCCASFSLCYKDSLNVIT